MDRTIPLRFDLAWELGGHTGHVTTLLPFAQALRARGHAVRFLLKSLAAGEDLEGMDAIERVAAPIWVGPHRFQNPRNFGEILTNFGYADPPRLHELIEAWRERLAGTAAVIANVAPAAHVAARTLGVPSFEISQGFHIPPPTMPSPPLRHWEPAPRAELEAADRAVLAAINDVLRAYAVAPLATIGDLFEGRAMLLTYPELDIYPERGPAEYIGIPRTPSGPGAADAGSSATSTNTTRACRACSKRSKASICRPFCCVAAPTPRSRRASMADRSAFWIRRWPLRNSCPSAISSSVTAATR
jgi:hypothetical protein